MALAGQITIEAAPCAQWRQDTYLIYALTHVHGVRILVEISMAGRYRVMQGGVVRYHGYRFALARAAFLAAQEAV